MANGSDTGSLCFEQASSIEMLIFNAPIDCTFCGLPSSVSASISGSASFSNRRVGWPNRPVQWAVAVYGQLQQQQQQRGHAYFIRQILGAPLKLLATPPWPIKCPCCCAAPWLYSVGARIYVIRSVNILYSLAIPPLPITDQISDLCLRILFRL